MAKRRPNGDGMVRKRADGRWEGRIIVGHKVDGKPIYKAVLAKTQKELIPKLNQLKETYAGQFVSNYNEIMAGAVMAIIPIVFLFLILQKYIMTGMSKAAMK